MKPLNETIQCFFLSVAILIVLTGCASFQGKQLSKVKSFPATTIKKSVYVDLAYVARVNSEQKTAFRESTQRSLEKGFVKRMKKSGMFGDISRDSNGQDITILVSLVDDTVYDNNEAFLTGLTLYLVPSSLTQTFHLRAKIIDNRTGYQNTIQLIDHVTMTQQLFLLPLLPFKSHLTEVPRCLNRLYDNTCLEISKTGLLEAL